MAMDELIRDLESQGYVLIREIPGRGLCALHKFLFTTGIVWGLDDTGHKGRWCYPNVVTAVVAYTQWNGIGDPPLNWIKYKGLGGERCNTILEHLDDLIKPDIMNITFHLEGQYEQKKIRLNGRELLPARSQKIRNHSPDGFNWGYGGSGPAQLSLAICLELLPEEQAVRVYQDLKFKLIAALPQGKDFQETLTYTFNGKSEEVPQDQ